jgi:anti-sigma regulatory factor (Ser/Thr protein kinase)/anti-anti-sigma regulatory factor
MIWKILTAREELEVVLPARLTRETMYPFFERPLDENADARCNRVRFDFSKLTWIDPVGIVILSNLFEYLNRIGASYVLANFDRNVEVIRYLDDSGFFKQYVGKEVFPASAVRATTIPLMLVKKERVYEFLDNKLMPWLGYKVQMQHASLATIRMCLDEVFMNIDHHSGVKIGCCFAQHFPRESRIHVAISDFGLGIPNVVRRVNQQIDDKTALWQACQEGFSTKSNVRNRGAGIPNLMRYVTMRNKGTVLIDSGRASISGVFGRDGFKLTAKSASGHYPGTLVSVLLRTDTLERVAEDVEPEEFSW